MRQVTLIALYGYKSPGLSQLISDCQAQLYQSLSGNFNPYDESHIHATILGLERVQGTNCINSNRARIQGKQELMDFGGLLETFLCGDFFPFRIQIGGFRERDYPFTSRGLQPYERSFSIQGDKAVVIGWPIQGFPMGQADLSPQELVFERMIYPNKLDEVRRVAQEFNFLHAYHRNPGSVDNDFYFRIGFVDNPETLDPVLLHSVEKIIRRHLSAIEPVLVEITPSDVYIAAYKDETLPLTTTELWPISDPIVTPGFIESLYDEVV